MEIKLLPGDPTVWGRCPHCCRTGIGVVVGDYYALAFPRHKWERGPRCENCETPLEFMYEVVA